MAEAEQQQQQQHVSLCAVENNGGGGGGSKAPRLPRWTRQEILVLIQGKKVAEGRVRRGRAAGLAAGTAAAAAVEPKWATVSSYCRRHGVNRGPVQCRKRWSNLAGDFKKIKEWEGGIRDESDSFWVMRSDLRRERKLPGFFDKEVFDILDGGPAAAATAAEKAEEDGKGGGDEKEDPEEAEDDGDGDGDEEAVFDSGRSAAADDGLFSDFEQSDVMDKDAGGQSRDQPPPTAVPVAAIPAPTPISEKQYEPFSVTGGLVSADPGDNEKQPGANPEVGSTSKEGRKRRRFPAEDDDAEEASPQNQLIQVLERNGRILTAQLEAQNINLKLDREERKDHASSLVAVLNKLADALGRIADKL